MLVACDNLLRVEGFSPRCHAWAWPEHPGQ